MRRWLLEFVGTFLLGVVVTRYAPQYLPWMCLFGALFLTWEGLREVTKNQPVAQAIGNFKQKVGTPMSLILVSLLGIIFALVYWSILQKALVIPTATSLPAPDRELQSHDPVLVIEPEDAMIPSTEDYHGQFRLYNAGTSDVERVEIYENYYLLLSSAPLRLDQVGPLNVKAYTVIATLRARDKKPFSIDYTHSYPFLVDARKNGQGGGWVAEIRLTYRRSFDGVAFTIRKVMWILGPRLLVDDTKRNLPNPPPGFPHVTSLLEIANALGGLEQKRAQVPVPTGQTP